MANCKALTRIPGPTCPTGASGVCDYNLYALGFTSKKKNPPTLKMRAFLIAAAAAVAAATEVDWTVPALDLDLIVGVLLRLPEFSPCLTLTDFVQLQSP